VCVCVRVCVCVCECMYVGIIYARMYVGTPCQKFSTVVVVCVPTYMVGVYVLIYECSLCVCICVVLCVYI
jgi:hypothetical protein